MKKTLPIADPITINEAAAIVEVTTSRIRQLLAKGSIRGFRWGHGWMVSRISAQSFERKQPGRPRKKA